MVEKRATEQEFLALRTRIRLEANIAAAGYPYPIDEQIADLRARLVQIRDNFIWAPGRLLVEDPSRVSTDANGRWLSHQALLKRWPRRSANC